MITRHLGRNSTQLLGDDQAALTRCLRCVHCPLLVLLQYRQLSAHVVGISPERISRNLLSLHRPIAHQSIIFQRSILQIFKIHLLIAHCWWGAIWSALVHRTLSFVPVSRPVMPGDALAISRKRNDYMPGRARLMQMRIPFLLLTSAIPA